MPTTPTFHTKCKELEQELHVELEPDMSGRER